MKSTETDKVRIRKLIKTINNSWINQKLEDMPTLLDEDVIFSGPGMKEQIKGIEPCIDSYREFEKSAIILHFENKEISLNLWYNIAVTNYSFIIGYEINAVEYKESGNEIMMFSKNNDQWKLLWRAITDLKKL